MSNKFLYINLILKTMIWETPPTAHHPPETFKVNRLDISGSRLDTTKHYSWSRSGLPLFFGSNPNQTLQFLWVDPLLSRSQTTYTDLNRLKQDELDTSDLSLVMLQSWKILNRDSEHKIQCACAFFCCRSPPRKNFIEITFFIISRLTRQKVFKVAKGVS